MPVSAVERHVPYSAAQMFDLVVDVERYREYIPFTFEARIIRRTADTIFAIQTISIGPLTLRFESQATFHRPDWIQIRSDNRQFRDFVIGWRFTDRNHGCEVATRVDCTPHSRVLGTLITPWLAGFTENLVSAFEQRAAAIYGNSPIPLTRRTE